MKWNNFHSKLKLDEVKTKKIKELLDSYKDQYVELCLCTSNESGKSPIEYAAELRMEQPTINSDDYSKKFLSFLSNEIEAVSDLTYVEVGMKFDLITRNKIYELLFDEQKEIFQSMKIESMLDVDTGYDPFGNRLSELITSTFSNMPNP